MTYNTGNPVPSTDPRDLDDNAQALDRFLQSSADSEPDRLGQSRRTYSYIERTAEALTSPNLMGLAALSPAANKGFYFTGTNGAMGLFDLSELGRTLAGIADQAAGRVAIGALGATENAASAAKLSTARTIAATGDGTWSVSFDGTGNVSGAFALANTGVAAGTYTRVTVDEKGRVTAGQTAPLAVANGGTGVTTQAAQVDAARAIKPAWTAYTPTVTAGGGTFTSISATGKYLLLFGVAHVDITITVTTRGTGINPIVTLPFAALAGSQGIGIPARETVQTGKTGVGRINTALTALNTTDYTGSGDLSTTDGCVIRIFGTYPIA